MRVNSRHLASASDPRDNEITAIRLTIRNARYIDADIAPLGGGGCPSHAILISDNIQSRG